MLPTKCHDGWDNSTGPQPRGKEKSDSCPLAVAHDEQLAVGIHVREGSGHDAFEFCAHLPRRGCSCPLASVVKPGVLAAMQIMPRRGIHLQQMAAVPWKGWQKPRPGIFSIACVAM